jgi:hypothetical protein
LSWQTFGGIPVAAALTIPSYANDAAAGIGGLVAGQLYQITGTGALFVKQ